MKSEIDTKSEERITKATELLQKLWWFSFYLVISPVAIGFVSFWIFRVFQLGTYAALSLSVIVFMFAFLFFLKAYDKYRENSFFLNKENNLVARIHITFLISLLSFIVTPIFIFISPADSFELLPLISFTLLYNIVYYYFRYKPIAFFNISEKEFQHAIDFKLSIKQPYNFILFVNYIIHIIFLALTSRTNLSWVFALSTNLFLYIFTLTYTKKTCNNIRDTIAKNRPILVDLTKFKQKFTISIISLVFILLIQLPLIIIIIFSFSGVQYTSLDLLNSSFLSIIFLFLYLKSLLYINFYYSKRIDLYIDSLKISNPDEITTAKSIKFQQYNSYFSGFLVVFITAFSFLIGIPVIVILVVPLFLIFSYSEQKTGICPKNHIRYIYLLNSLAFLITISFGLLSDIQLNYQFLVFLISLYFVLQVFVKAKYFSKQNILIIQNILAIVSFTIIVYSFFEYATFESLTVFEISLFSSDPILVFISNFILHGLIISIVSLISFYVLYIRYFFQKPSQLFRTCLLINIFLIILFIFLWINFRTFFLVEILMFSSLLFPSILLVFVFINFLLGVFSQEYFSKLSYYLLWMLVGDIFLSLLVVYLTNYVIITLDFLILSFLSQLNLKYGLKLERVKESTVKRFIKTNSYFMTIELILLFFFFFYSIALATLTFYNKIILSIYFSFVIMTILANFLSRNEIVFSRSITNKINIIILFSSSGLAFYYPFLFTFGSCYIFLLPFMGLIITLYLPFYYLIRKRLYESVIKKALLINSVLLTGLISLIPTINHFEFYRIGQPINLLQTINSTLLIFPFTCLLFIAFDYLIKLLSREKLIMLSYYSVWILIIDIFAVITISSIPNLVYLTLGLLFLSISSQLNLRFGVKIKKVKGEIVTKYTSINSYIISGELFALSFFFFLTVVFLEILIALYISTLIITVLVNFLSKKEFLFSESLMIRMNIIALTFTAGLVYYYSLLFTINTYYVILIPSICLFSILFFPIYYMLKKGIFKKYIHRAMLINCILLAIFLTLIPTIVNLELIRLGISFDIMSTFNYSLYLAFGILTFTYYLLKKYNLKEIYVTRILKSQIFIELIIAGTTVFYYTYILLFGTYFSFLFPLIAASFFLYLPSVFSYRKRYFKEIIVKKSLMVNSILISVLIALIPTITGLEFIRLGFEINIFIIIATSLILIFLTLEFLIVIGNWYKIREKWNNFLKLMQLFSWFSISLFTAFVIISYIIIELSISISIFTFFILNIFSLKLLLNYSRDLKIIRFLEEILLYGLVFSFSMLITSIIQFSRVFTSLPSVLSAFNVLWYLGLFLLVFVPLIRFFSSQVRIIHIKVNNCIGFGSWLILKTILCLFISFTFSFSILAPIISFSLTFTFFTPITLSYFKKLEIFSEETQLDIKNFMLGIFIISTLVLFGDLSYRLITNEVFFNDYLFFNISFILANSLLLLYFTLLRYNTALEEDSTFRIFGFYLSSFLLFSSLLFTYRIIYVAPIVCVLILILYRRSLNLVFRFSSYFLLSYVVFIDLLSIFSDIGILGGFDLTKFGFLSSTYLLTLGTVLLLSILFNSNRNNNLEKLVLYCLLSLISFILLYTYSGILLLYNITISLFIFLFLVGIYFYRQGNELYKWFIKPCVLLLIFDFISFISYAILFNNPVYINFNPILTFTLTMSLTGFTFILLYNKAPARFRKVSFYFILFAIIFSFPLFLYFIIIASLPGLVGEPIPIIIVINVGVLFYYLSVGIYQWKISWAIWKSGWYVWNILPIANFWIIYPSLRGVDILTESINLFGVFELRGSSILAIIICSLLFIPVMYSKIKKYFTKIILIVWGESLFLLYWVSQNLFTRDIGLRNLSFILFSVFLLMPFLTALKYWKIASLFWLGLMGINVFFLYFYLSLIGLPFEMTLSIDILAIGLFLIVYSFYPNIRSIGVILIISYFIVLFGIFLVIYFLIYSIVLSPVFSINISLMVMGFSLFSSKPLKLVNKLIDQVLSWILIINFSWFTFNTFSLLPELDIFAFFLAMTVFGGSFFIFNRYKMKFRINMAVPFLIVAIGASASISTLLSILFNLSIYNEISIFSGFFTIFLYFLVIEYRYFLWALVPIPFTLPILGFLVSIPMIHSLWVLGFLSFSTIYLIIFQIIINLFKSKPKERDEEIENSIMKIFQDRNQFRLLNLTSLLLNSVFISLLISILVPLLNNQFLFSGIIYVYQILDFLTILPIFVLLSLKYIENSEFDLKIRDPLLHFNRISFILYLIIPVALSINIFLFMLYREMSFIITFFTVLLSLSGIMFIESFIIDKRFFYYLFNSIRDKFTFWSWAAFCNIISLFFFLFYPNPFLLLVLISLLNQISLYFLSYLDIPKAKISNGRIILYYTLFISGSFYLGSLISEGIVNIFEELKGFTYYTLLFQNSVLFIFILSIFLVKIDTKLKSSIEIVLFTAFQSLLAINWILIFNLLNTLNIFSIILIIAIETCLLFKTATYLNVLFFETKRPTFQLKTFSMLIIFLYFEISALFYGLMFEIAQAGFLESLLISQLIFFALTLIDIYSLKKLKRGFAQLIHTLSYFVISLMKILILNNFMVDYQILLGVETLIFVIMQLYTNYSFFTSLKQLNTEKMEIFKKWSANINHVLGICIYLNLGFILFQALIFVNADLQLILLSLSLLIHVLTIIDISLMKFLGRVANYFRMISWVFIMIFTTTYLIWLYIDYFITFLFTSIPLIIFILIIETTYLFKLLSFWDYIKSNKQKIKSLLLLITYLDFISWPIYFARLDTLYLLNLTTLSLAIMFFFTYIDKCLGVLKEKLLKNVRKTSFLTIGLLLSIISFISLNSIPNSTLALNLSVSLLIFVVFLGIIVKPFKGHSLKASAFWAAMFSLFSVIISELSQFWQIIPVIVILMIPIYAFVFLLEELRELFNNFVDILIKFFRKIESLIINAFKALYKFVKNHFKIIWFIFSAAIAIFLGILLSELFLSILLGIIHPTLLTIAIFAFLILVVPSSKTSDPDIIFKRRILRLSYGWGSIIAFLFIYITPVWYIFTIFISIAVAGSIVLIFIGRKEEREKISVKWRFYTLLSLFIFLIIFGILFFIQLLTINI